MTNGISSLNDLVFHLTILPKNLYIETRDLVVTEGQETTLTLSNIHVITDYFVDKINDYLIVDPPTSGRLVSVDHETSKSDAKVLPAVTIFSVEDLEQQRIRVRKYFPIKCSISFKYQISFILFNVRRQQNLQRSGKVYINKERFKISTLVVNM